MNLPGYVYILATWRGGPTHVGATPDLEQRLREHRDGLVEATKDFDALRLVHYERYDEIEEAVAREARLKKWNREMISELIDAANPDWRDLAAEPNLLSDRKGAS